MRQITPDDYQVINNVIHRYWPHMSDTLRTELVSAGHYGLAQAALRFDPDRHGPAAKFNTYAWHRVHGAMLDALRKADHLTRPHRQSVTVGTLPDPGAPISLDLELWAATAPDPVDPHQELEDRDSVQYALAHLTPREQLVIRCVDLHDWPTKDVALLLGVGRSRVIQIRLGALKRMRQVLSDSLRSVA